MPTRFLGVMVWGAFVATGCLASGSPAWTITRPSSPIRVAAARGCPPAVAGFDGVLNPSPGPGPGLASHLVPSGPAAALICRYGGINAPAQALYREALARAGQAAQLAVAADASSTQRPAGIYHCPVDFGSVTILVFAYPRGPEVALWYKDSGCPSLNNGVLSARPSGDVAEAVNRLAPPQRG